MQTSQRAVLSLKDKKEERKVKYIRKNLKYVKPMIKERLKSTGFLIILYTVKDSKLQRVQSLLLSFFMCLKLRKLENI